MPVLGTNNSALNASFFVNVAGNAQSRSLKRLSSGSKLANAQDDAAGLAVSGKLDSTILKLRAAAENAQNLMSFAQTSDGYLQTIQQELTRMSELAFRALNGAFSASDRSNYSIEFEQLTSNISSQISNAKFNGTAIFGTGSISSPLSADGSNFYTLSLIDASSSVSAVAALDITTISGASSAIDVLTSALENIVANRSTIGANISALEFYTQNIGAERINNQTGNSRIKDVDFAEESTTLAKDNILLQASTSMLAQANVTPQTVLNLLR